MFPIFASIVILSLRDNSIFRNSSSQCAADVCTSVIHHKCAANTLARETLFTRAKKNRHGTPDFWHRADVLRHGTPNFRRVNISVPNVMWHQCSKFLRCRDYLPMGKRGTVPKIWRALLIF